MVALSSDPPNEKLSPSLLRKLEILDRAIDSQLRSVEKISKCICTKIKTGKDSKP